MDKLELSHEMDRWLENPYLDTIAFFSVVIIALLLFLTLFELITKYKVWDEIKKGNLSVAMATSGKIFGICNVFRFSILNNDTLWHSLIWASLGFVLLVFAYFLFELLTPFFKVDGEIQRDNRAIGLLSMTISVSLSFVIGACVV